MYTFLVGWCSLGKMINMNYFNEIDIAETMVKKMLGTISPREEEKLQKWVALSSKNREVYEDFMSGRSYAERKKNFGHLKHEKTMVAVHEKINRKIRRKMYVRISSMAAVLLVAVMGAVIAFSLRDTHVSAPVPLKQGKYYALLSVNDGQQVMLKENNTGTEWQQVVKERTSSKVGAEEQARIVRVEVPRGSEYWLRLNDSTEVWLNSETVLEYPERFAKDKREVFLKGEAFFDVKSNPTYPFEVRTTEDLSIRVTGTELNVRNYTDEQYLKVTLIEGIVYVGNDSLHNILSPSEQAIFDRETGNIQVVLLENPSTSMAWREGMFAFESESIEVILTALSQWYDVEFLVENRERIPKRSVTFHALRDEKVEDLLGVLQSLVDFKYRVEGKKIHIHF